MATINTAVKNRALHAAADAVLGHTHQILAANAADLDVALYGTRHDDGQRRTERLWLSYPASEELGAGPLSLAG